MNPIINMNKFRKKIHDIIFFSDTPAGKWFDIVLITVIVLSVLAVMIDSVKSISDNYSDLLITLEWIFTIIFTIEYLIRIWTHDKPLRYIFSFYGIIDLLSIIPTYISLVLPGTQYLTVIRILRVLRIFRILKLVKFLGESKLLVSALKASRRKIIVFIMAVLSIVVIVGSIMYVIEGADHGFTSIPRSIYWAIVTLTTVGYGDISPSTPLGQLLASMIMIMGYAIIAVPTGIVTVGLAEAMREERDPVNKCPRCDNNEIDSNANFCKICGNELPNNNL